MINRALFSSDKHDWQMPGELFWQLDAEFGFEIDVCPVAENAKCQHCISPQQNGLAQSWRAVCWMNPPTDRVCQYGWQELTNHRSMEPRWFASFPPEPIRAGGMTSRCVGKYDSSRED
jgi:hypothetical protein